MFKDKKPFSSIVSYLHERIQKIDATIAMVHQRDAMKKKQRAQSSIRADHIAEKGANSKAAYDA